MKTLKSFDGKSFLIGGLLASTIFFAMGATSPTDKWDDEQQWETAVLGYGVAPVPNGVKWVLVTKTRNGKNVYRHYAEWPKGWEPVGTFDDTYWEVRRRIK